MTPPRRPAKKALTKKASAARGDKPAAAGRTTKKSPTKKATPKKAPPRTRGSATPKKRTSAPRTRRADARDKQVLELRRAGVRLDVIAAQLKFRDVVAAHDAYERALHATLPQTVEEGRRLELERLDQLQTRLWPKALRGDLAAMDRLFTIAHARMQLLSRSDPLPETGKRHRGLIETATFEETERLKKNAPALAAAALELARQCDDTKGEPGLLATAARELRMTMSQLRGLAGLEPPNRNGAPPPDGDKDKSGGTVVPPSRLEGLRQGMQRG